MLTIEPFDTLNNKYTAFLLAAPSSGSGKTTITLALLRTFARRGLVVQPFKCGPDYLDTRLHTMAASFGGHERAGINLDTFMASKEHVQGLFSRYSSDADVAVVEGVMGLFDGAEKSEGSSAEIAMLLGIPVVMVINAHSMAYSAAPMLYGFRTFDPALNLAGVIFNQVNTASHYSYLEAAARDAGVEPLGYVPRSEAVAISERHLGLDTSAGYDRECVIEAMAEHVGKTVDVDRLLEIAQVERPSASVMSPSIAGGNKLIAVARDEAFNFVYRENIELLRQYGRVVFFSPLHDERLPEAEMVYLAGGYPELYAEQLSSNSAMREQIAAFSRSGGRLYAECGGMMYLGKTITLKDGSVYPMCGALDLETTMQESRLTLGYRSVVLDGSTAELRGHEFHYSRISHQGALQNIATVNNARGEHVATPLFRKENTTASYIHLYWGEMPQAPVLLFSLESE
ncbi:MAG: cobyrinate a,c-diamide synthase [Chlorobium sp.]